MGATIEGKDVDVDGDTTPTVTADADDMFDDAGANRNDENYR